MELKLTKAKVNHLLGLLEINDREGYYYGNKKHYLKRHTELITDLKLLLNGKRPNTSSTLECLKKVREIEQLNLGVVSKRSELLIAYGEYIGLKDIDYTPDDIERDINSFLKSNL